MILTSPMNKQIVVHDDGRIEGDLENLAGWVKSGSHRDQDAYVQWFLFLKQWERQTMRDKVVNDPGATWQDLVNATVGKNAAEDLVNAVTIKNIKEKEGLLNMMKKFFS